MAWCSVKIYEGLHVDKSAGVLIDVSPFEAPNDERAKSEARSQSLLGTRGCFASLLNSQDEIMLATPKGPDGQKRPGHVIGAAIMVAKIATG
jgi:hypothetical protein